MAIPGYGTAIAILFQTIDKFIPSKKGALYNQFQSLIKRYDEALKKGQNSKASIALKQIHDLMEKCEFTEGDL